MTRDSRWRRAFLVFTGCVLQVLLLVGCDTVAEISIDTRNFTTVDSTGVLNALECDNTDVNVVVHFTMADEKGVLISPNERVGNGILHITGQELNFHSDHVEFSNQSVLYPSPDQECGGNDDCTAPFTCEAINPFNEASSRRICGIPIVIETFQEEVRFDDGSDAKRIAVVMDYSQTLEGLNPDGSYNATRSTDPQNKRISAAQAFILGFRRSHFAESSRMCVVSFGGEGRAAVNFRPDPSSCMSVNFDQALTQVSQMTVGEVGKSPIWSAVLETIDQQLAGASGDKIMVLFTDGLDDGSLTDTFEDALAAAVDNNVTVHIVQLDNPPPEDEEGTGPKPYIGPEDQFARLACETGGSFQYAQAPEDLRPLFSALATSVSARYEASLQVGQLSSTEIEPGRYRIATAMDITVLGERRSFQFAGDQTDVTSVDIVDRRLTVFKRPVPARPEPEPEEGEGEGEGEGTE